jgi:regulator of sigma E protease
MDTSSLAGLIFILVFAGMILIHELGHYIASRLVGVEIEEFGFGLPPRAWTFWRLAGHFLTKSGKRIEIPSNFGLPFPWAELNGQQVKFTVDRLEDKFVLRTLTVVEEIQEKRPRVDPVNKEEILVGQNGEIVHAQQATSVKTRTVEYGKTRGALELDEAIRETHPGTEFTLNWLPLGGFVRPKGENDPNVPGGLAAANPWKRLAVLLAGPAMNLIAGVIVYSLIFTQAGIPTQVKLDQVMEGAPAALAGLQHGDTILSVNGQAISTVEGLRMLIRRNLDHPLNMIVERDGQTLEITATPLSSRYKEGALGITMDPIYTPADTWFDTLPASLLATYEQSYEILSMPAQMARGFIDPEDGRFIGLKGIFELFKMALGIDTESRASAPSEPAPAPTYTTFYLIAILTISIGLFNLLPFPALDGGRIAFVLPELIIRRRVPPQFENAVHAAGMALLILLMIYVNVMDFVDPLQLQP